MIYLDKTDSLENNFIALLEKARQYIISQFKHNGIPKNIDGTAFESIVFEAMVIAASGTEFESHIKQTGKYAFPDIVAKKLFGVEVKMTIADKWVSTGNSVLESTRIQDVETIFMFFGKFGGETFDAKYRKYQECLSDVAVTHSPRYKIDMNLPIGDSIFDKIAIEYSVFRQDDGSIKKLKEYYRKQLKEGEELWWIDPAVEEKSVSPIIKTFTALDEETQRKFIMESFILFPEILGNSSKKYQRAAAYLITEYNALSSNIRDSFSAQGRAEIQVDTLIMETSRTLYILNTFASAISKLIKTMPKDKLEYYWNTTVSNDPLSDWKTKARDYIISSGSRSGLNEKQTEQFLETALK